MCGIAGIVNNDINAISIELTALLDGISHRGPDASGNFLFQNVGFTHSRLSILELSPLGAQPMVSNCGRYVIIFNGEIYNFRELRKELEAQSFVFKGGSDTEVLLNAFALWGHNCIYRLSGMFAFAIFDRKEETIFLARDQVGKKPLYYLFNGSRFIFSSEPQGILGFTEQIDAISPDGLMCYLNLGYIISPYTLHPEIKKIPPGHWVKLDLKTWSIKTERFWDYVALFRKPKLSLSLAETAEILEEKLRKAIRIRLHADVPVGTFLSGGLDSGLVSAMASQMTDSQLTAFCVSFGSGSKFNESHFAKKIANDFSLKLEIINFQKGESTVPAFIVDPIADNSMLAMLQLAQAAANKRKVVLSGDGADEVFAGYPTYRAENFVPLFLNLPKFLRSSILTAVTAINKSFPSKVGMPFKLFQFLRGIESGPALRHVHWRQFFLPEQIIKLPIWQNLGVGNDFEGGHIRLLKKFHQESEGISSLERLLYIDAKTWLSENILPKVDRSSMMFGLEVRCPFLDLELLAFAAQIKDSYKINASEGKLILKQVAEKIIGAQISRRKKSGFNVPIRNLAPKIFMNEYQYFAYDILRRTRIKNVDI